MKLELLCKQLHEANDGVQRQEAEKALVEFQSGRSSATLSQCQLLLDRAQSSYSQFLAATTLTKLVSRNPCTLTLQQRIDISKNISHLCYHLSRIFPCYFFPIRAVIWLSLRLFMLSFPQMCNCNSLYLITFCQTGVERHDGYVEASWGLMC